MKLLTAPDRSRFYQTRHRLFLAGGISGCGDWQKDVAKSFKDLDITIFNPRREGTLNRKDLKVSTEQIQWEREHILDSTHILFWFPDTSVCPIALFELGGALDRTVGCGKRTAMHQIFVGAAPGYDRLVDLQIQIPTITKNHYDNYIPIHSTLDALVAAVREELTRPPFKISWPSVDTVSRNEAFATEGADLPRVKKTRVFKKTLP